MMADRKAELFGMQVQNQEIASTAERPSRTPRQRFLRHENQNAEIFCGFQ
jgi:hypothetical protein